MELRDLTATQLDRLYRRVYRSLPYGGCFGWDWTTLHSAYPAKYRLLRAIALEHNRKLPAANP